MGTVTFPLKGTKACAFCKFWWDLACRHIEPKSAQFWAVDAAAKCLCLKRNTLMSATAQCGEFRCKIEL